MELEIVLNARDGHINMPLKGMVGEFNLTVTISFRHQNVNSLATTMVLMRPCMKHEGISGYHLCDMLPFPKIIQQHILSHELVSDLTGPLPFERWDLYPFSLDPSFWLPGTNRRGRRGCVIPEAVSAGVMQRLPWCLGKTISSSCSPSQLPGAAALAGHARAWPQTWKEDLQTEKSAEASESCSALVSAVLPDTGYFTEINCLSAH